MEVARGLAQQRPKPIYNLKQHAERGRPGSLESRGTVQNGHLRDRCGGDYLLPLVLLPYWG